jgi:tetratricopeptide (TPR) repeat protein
MKGVKGMRVLFPIIVGISLYAQNYDSLMAKGDMYYEQFDNIKALSEYEKAYELNPESYEALMKVVRAYNDVGEDLSSKQSEAYFLKAVQYGETLVEKHPNVGESYLYLSIAYGNLALFRGGKEKVKLSRSVEKNIKKAIQLDPNDDRAYVVLGIYYREVANLNWFLKAFAKSFLGGLPDGSNEGSERMFLKAIKLNPSRPRTYYELAKTYDKMKKKEKIVKCLQKVIELPIDDHKDKQMKQEAQDWLRKLIKK